MLQCEFCKESGIETHFNGPHWHKQAKEVLKLAKYLDENGHFKTTSNVIYFFEKPWKYEKEYRQMKEEWAFL